MKETIKKVFIKKDERNAIVLAPDTYKGISVQVVRFVDQLKPNPEGILETHRVMHPIWNRRILSTIGIDESVDKPKDGKNFKSEVNKAIEEARSYIAKVEGLDNMIDGTLNDYLSQNQKLNQ